jgi:hypothetical protein
MALNIVGTFPILNQESSQTDQYGFTYKTFQFTVLTSTLSTLPKKDDVFIGLGTARPSIVATTSEPDIVTEVRTNQMMGGLSEVTIQTTGANKPIESNKPVVTIRQGGPLIFGLGSKIFSAEGVGKEGVGQLVQIAFLDEGGVQSNSVINTYLFSLMPTNFRGVLIPAYREPFNNIINGAGDSEIRIAYNGYVCKSVNIESRGALALFTLSYSESGSATRRTPTEVSIIYNFPTTG